MTELYICLFESRSGKPDVVWFKKGGKSIRQTALDTITEWEAYDSQYPAEDQQILEIYTADLSEL